MAKKKKLGVKYFKNKWKLLGKFLNAYKNKKEENGKKTPEKMSNYEPVYSRPSPQKKSERGEWSLRLQNSDEDFITSLGAFAKVILNLSIN